MTDEEYRDYEWGKLGVRTGGICNGLGLLHGEQQKGPRNSDIFRPALQRPTPTPIPKASTALQPHSTPITPGNNNLPLDHAFKFVDRALGFETRQQRKRKCIAFAFVGALAGLVYGLSAKATGLKLAGYAFVGAVAGACALPLLLMGLKLLIIAMIAGFIGLVIYGGYKLFLSKPAPSPQLFETVIPADSELP